MLLLPTLYQAFLLQGMLYALLLGIYGVLVLFGGITLIYRNFIYVGAAAIFAALFSQTYVYVFSLPRWLMTATGGILFLALAIYLLLRRGDQTSKK